MIGANFEARPNVVVDIASQFVKSRNAGVLRTGSAAIRSAVALADQVIAPALSQAGLDPAMIQLVRVPGQDSARALVRQPGLIPLVILRGSGDSTRSLAAEAARNGVRTMAHADGGAVLYLDAAAETALAETLIEASLDRLGVCNRLNLLLVHPARWDELVPRLVKLLDRLDIAASLPPHVHPLGHEWALDAGHEATVTIASADGPREAADAAMAERLIEAGLDRLGVCNRLNLQLVHPARWDELLPGITRLLSRLGLAASLPPHAHRLGHEWALDAGHEATVTIAPADGPRTAAVLANEETSGLAAAIVTQDRAAAAEFLGAYAGTGAFWNATTRLLDGFKLFSVPETGINIDAVPGPRGPVTFRDLYLRQFVVTPA